MASTSEAIPIVADKPRNEKRKDDLNHNTIKMLALSSPEGRFSIIDEQPKDPASVESDFDDLEDSMHLHNSSVSKEDKTSRASTEPPCDCQPPNDPRPPTPSFSSGNLTFSTTSRFKIVPVDSTFKRGRWTCWDYYDTEIANNNGAKIVKTEGKMQQIRGEMIEFDKGFPTGTTPPSVVRVEQDDSPILTSNADSATRSVKPSASSSIGPSKAVDIYGTLSPSTPLNTSIDSDVQLALKKDPSESKSTTPIAAVTPSLLLEHCLNEQQSLVNKINCQSVAVRNDSGSLLAMQSLTSGQLLNRTLGSSTGERSSLWENLLPGTIPPMGSPHGVAPNVSTNTGSDSHSGPNLVAIDSKIEQAMDLVKTHLMFAVREEVEILRATIVDLETKVVRLESENVILRDNVPTEILAKIAATTNQSKETANSGPGS